MNAPNNSRPQLKIRRVNLDTGHENVVVISRRSKALRAEVFRGFSRVELRCNFKVLLATLLLTDDGMVGVDELAVAEPAFRRFGESVAVTPAAPPNSLDAVRAKIQGRVLGDAEIAAIVDDVTHYRYSDMEIAAFLIGSASFMTSGELLALAHAMAQAGTQLTWDRPVVVDKHCIGGIPGNRTSMVVVPIVAAHGLMIPKTSSRAITSPAGTADTMEVLARVDLSIHEMKEVVAACHGCLIWGGHVNLSPADDIFISVERPLSLDTREQMVASIMSKKIAAGSTHLLIDLPVGPSAKLTNAMEAMRLRKLFEFVGDHFGIAVEVITTDGRQPIGNGIGPVLEAQDVMAVLSNDPAAPRRAICARNRCGWPRTCSTTIRSCAAAKVMRGRANCSTAGSRSSRCTRSSTRRGRPAAAPISAVSPPTCRRSAAAWSRRSTACGSTGWRAPPGRRSTKAPASRCSKRSATGSSRASRSTASTHSTHRNSIWRCFSGAW
jgi:thymidine phosphorylase